MVPGIVNINCAYWTRAYTCSRAHYRPALSRPAPINSAYRCHLHIRAAFIRAAAHTRAAARSASPRISNYAEQQRRSGSAHAQARSSLSTGTGIIWANDYECREEEPVQQNLKMSEPKQTRFPLLQSESGVDVAPDSDLVLITFLTRFALENRARILTKLRS